MVTYGEWITPPEMERVIPFGASSWDDGGITTGLRIEAKPSRGVEASRTTDPATAAPDDTVSPAVWGELPDEPIEPMGLLEGARLRYVGTHIWFIGPPGRYVQSDRWEWQLRPYRLWRQPTSLEYPSPDEWPPGAIAVEREDYGPIHLTSMQVDPVDRNGGTGSPVLWDAYMRPVGAADPWFSDASMTPGLAVSYPKVTDGFLFSEAQVATLQTLIDADAATDDPRWPEFTIAYNGPWPGIYDGIHDLVTPPSEWDYGSPVTVVLRYRFQLARYRFVFEDSRVPIRRTFPRDDGRAGGAPRTFPQSRALQSSNRTTGGYL